MSAALVAAALAAALTGCVTSGSCVGWHDHETPQAAYDDARLVVIGEVTGRVGTRNLFGVVAPVHRVEVAEVLKGTLEGPTVDVASTPVTCTGGEDYPDGDPLDVEGDVILLLSDPPDAGGWRLITPFDGVLIPPDDGELPFEVEDREP